MQEKIHKAVGEGAHSMSVKIQISTESYERAMRIHAIGVRAWPSLTMDQVLALFVLRGIEHSEESLKKQSLLDRRTRRG